MPDATLRLFELWPILTQVAAVLVRSRERRRPTDQHAPGRHAQNEDLMIEIAKKVLVEAQVQNCYRDGLAGLSSWKEFDLVRHREEFQQLCKYA